VIAIVHPRTFSQWLSKSASGIKRRKRGRPRTPEQIRQPIVETAKATGWGYRRIFGDLKKLGFRGVSQATIRRILQEHGFDIGPRYGIGAWHEFVHRHIETLWVTDFHKKVWTLRGPVTYYVLFFIHLHTRRVHTAGMTPNPDGLWMALAARNMSITFSEEPAGF
jgi:putative transposase